MRIWIFNHYATDMYFDGAGRHQSFAKYLIRDGNEVKIFCASTVHNSDININTGDKKSNSVSRPSSSPHPQASSAVWHNVPESWLLSSLPRPFRKGLW